MNNSHRRFRRWLAAYPKEYRDVRGEEILGTLLESSPEGGGPAPRDALAIVVHGTGVRLRVLARCFGRGRLPRSVHWATNLLVFVAGASWVHAATADNGPRNPTSPGGGVLVGIALIALCLMLRTWSRLLYATVIVTLFAFLVAVVVTATPPYAGLVLGAPFLIAAVLLVIGWRRYMEGPAKVDLGLDRRTQTG